jgi:hypothetical protein
MWQAEMLEVELYQMPSTSGEVPAVFVMDDAGCDPADGEVQPCMEDDASVDNQEDLVVLDP